MKETVKTQNAPQPLGPYSQAVKVGNFLFVSGQGPINPKTGKIDETEISAQARQTLQNVKAIVEASGFLLQDVVKVSIFLKNASDFQKMNEVYKTYFQQDPPTRTTVQADFVTPNMLIEIDAIACRD
jgi:2-iminobutanoate/2-iminopropanoate deaminase